MKSRRIIKKREEGCGNEEEEEEEEEVRGEIMMMRLESYFHVLDGVRGG